MKCGVVIIGRNEGARLVACLRSVPGGAVYVDSGSTDESVKQARSHGAEVIELDMDIPFTAARARNAGFRRLRELTPDLVYAQFVDGDCELRDGWLKQGVNFLDTHDDVGVVFGRLREREPERSIYNWLSDQHWDRPAGDTLTFGGIAMIRVAALAAVGGYREDMIAGEEPELSVRLRRAGWRIVQLDCEMAWHDLAITRFGQWWRRAVRGGYASAQGAYLHGASPERHCVWESRRTWFWGAWLPLGCFAAGVAFGPWGWLTWLIYPLQLVRQTFRNRGTLDRRLVFAVFQLLSRFPETVGQIKFLIDRFLRRQARLIEY